MSKRRATEAFNTEQPRVAGSYHLTRGVARDTKRAAPARRPHVEVDTQLTDCAKIKCYPAPCEPGQHDVKPWSAVQRESVTAGMSALSPVSPFGSCLAGKGLPSCVDGFGPSTHSYSSSVTTHRPLFSSEQQHLYTMPTETPRSSSRPSHKDLPPLVPSGLNAGYYHLPLPNIEPVPTIEPVQQAPTPSDTTPGMEASPSPPARRPSSRASPIAENEIAKATMGVCVIEGCEGTDQKRKVVSQFFGRNKSATMNLPDAIYMPMCRRHYQRTAYKDKQRGKWCSKQAQMVARVFDAIDKKGVEQRWTIKTSKGIKDTLDDDNERNAAAPRNKKPKRSEASNLTNSQREKLQDLEAQCPEARKLLHLCGQNKSTKEATEALTELHQASMKEDMPDELIHFEFLAQIDIREAWTEAVRRDSQ